ncbi:hypothetical protein N7513_002160 [Penicillium frequentans]|uniref:RING-type E3 ubiquitin transferase n=1 Tax=Penicillium frequentans TaxID=3151616 RepID=A0AAD6GL42_9EURO|nr:hypothetical protein N7494_000223 [Penicillium glabrum]KAJ5559761.1 hypothetical protein N7513_002160 [Penicillium glabrum]
MRPFFLSYFFVSVLATVTVLPSNNSQDLSWSSSVRFRLQASGSLNGLTLAPLTQSLVRLTDSEKEAFHIPGNVTKVVAEDSVGLNSSSIACIPCDSSDYPGPFKADRTIDTVDSQSTLPGAIILYSSSASHCNLTTDDIAESYRNIFTVINSRSSTLLQAAFGSNNTLAAIGSMSAPVTGVDTNTGTGTGTGGDSPNTAMIILYSITGIITALFLGIIITGAVRAHRHPERYGPRRVAGRIRQSRARGIARAMLETIPIVKFGDESPGDGVDAAKRDVEMVNHESGHEPGHEHSPRSESIANVEETNSRETDLPEQESDHPIAAAPEHKTDATPDAGNFSCPICTDDFVKGQDLRVLPCQHQFHLECIDPWLVNVSGTCPLCRIDLNPPKTEENAEQGESAEHTEETPTEEAGTSTDATTHRHSHHRLTNYLNARRMHNATVEERLAALRHVRAANQGNAADAIPAASRQRLSTRLRERFRIRSRTHGVESLSPGESGATTPTVTTPTVPAPAHIAETETETEPQTNETVGLPTNSSR